MTNNDNPLVVNRMGRVGILTLNRPAVKNAIDEEMVIALHRSLREMARDKGVGAVVLQGCGDAFCAGADIKNMAAGDSRMPKYSPAVLLRLGAECAMLLHEMPKPTIALMRGPAMGGGLALALACDFRLADASVKLSYAHTKIALSGDFAAAYFLSKWMGAGKAREFCLLNPVYDANRGVKSGMLSRLCEASALEDDVMAMARQLADGPTLALGCIKDNLKQAEALSCDAYIQAEADNFLRCRNSEEHREALTAFLEKRPPRFPYTESLYTEESDVN